MHISRLPRSCGAVCLSLGIGLFTSSNVSASDFSYGFLELSPQHWELDDNGSKLRQAGLGAALSIEISDTSYLRFDGGFFDTDQYVLTQYRTGFGVHQSITSRIDTFQEVGAMISRDEVSGVSSNATDFLIALGLRMKPVNLIELEAKAGFAGPDPDYKVGIRFLGEKELKGASLGFGYSVWKNENIDVDIASLDFRFNF